MVNYNYSNWTIIKLMFEVWGKKVGRFSAFIIVKLWANFDIEMPSVGTLQTVWMRGRSLVGQYLDFGQYNATWTGYLDFTLEILWRPPWNWMINIKFYSDNKKHDKQLSSQGVREPVQLAWDAQKHMRWQIEET